MALVDTKKLSQQIEDHISIQLVRLEQPVEEVVTARIRGRIAGCRYMLDVLAKMDAPTEEST